MTLMGCISVVLLAMGISSCRGLSLGRSNPLLSRQQTSTRLFGSPPRKKQPARYGLDIGKHTSVRRNRNQTEGSELYGYLDKLDRESGLNYNDYWGSKQKKKGNATEIVDNLQNIVETAPKPLNKLVSDEMWYVS